MDKGDPRGSPRVVHREVDPERIGAWGHSTAAGVAIVAGAIDRRLKAVACQNASMLDAWTALQTSRGRAQLNAIRALMLQDFERRCQTGQGTSIPALPTDDPKLAGYVAQAEELFPSFTGPAALPADRARGTAALPRHA